MLAVNSVAMIFVRTQMRGLWLAAGVASERSDCRCKPRHGKAEMGNAAITSAKFN